MSYRVLIVDDSAFYRTRLTSLLEKDPSIEVIGHAANGLEAIEKAISLKPDVITMDVEMPVMDGISAVSKIMKQAPTAILMFSSLTTDGAKATLDALEAGAADFIPKKFDDISTERPAAILLIQRRIKALARKREISPSPLAARPNINAPIDGTSSLLVSRSLHAKSKIKMSTSISPLPASGKRYKLLLIGASTGGPLALQKIISAIPKNFPCPVLLVQHMPGSFTGAFAQRLNTYAQLKVKLAEDNDRIEAGNVYLAQGGKQMQVTGKGTFARIKICDAPKDRVIHYQPCIDFTMESLVSAYSGDVLSVILTGMGADGASGSSLLKSAGATIWAQDEASCVVYGMPKSVVESGSCDRVIRLEDIAQHIIQEVQG